MEILINEMLKRGAIRGTLEAKIFGGGHVIEGTSSLKIGERNAAFAVDYLKTERIPIVSRDVLGMHARKLCFLPSTGKAMVKRLVPHNPGALWAQDTAQVCRATRLSTDGGSVDIF